MERKFIITISEEFEQQVLVDEDGIRNALEEYFEPEPDDFTVCEVSE